MKGPEPLRLIAGPDRFLQWLPALAALGGLLATLLLEQAPHEKNLLIAGVITVSAAVLLWPRRDAQLEVVLSSGQLIKWRLGGGPWHGGVYCNDCWSCKYYAVISGHGPGWRKRFLFSQSLQDKKTFRILVAHIRLAGEELQRLI